MPNHPKLQEWQQRVEHLCAQIVKRPELTWLWEIRIKILMYLIRRYGETTESQPDFTPTVQVRSRTTIPALPVSRPSPCTATRSASIRSLLQSIHRVNRESKAARC